MGISAQVVCFPMKIPKFIALFLLVLALIVDFGSLRRTGELVAYSQDLEDVHQVSFSAMGELVVTQGDRDRLTVSAEESLLRDFDIVVDDGVLFISLKDVPPASAKSIQFNLTVQDLDRVELSGLGNINARLLNSATFNADVSGTGTLAIDHLTADHLVVNGSGAGRIQIAGQVVDQTVMLSGAGQYLASDLQSESATIDLSGIGNAVLWATNRLAIQLSGAGQIQYYGSPIVSRDISGRGVIDYLGKTPT